MISCRISSNSFSTLFIKTNSSWLIFESIKALKINIFTIFNLDFAIDNILSCFSLYFLIIDLHFLILAVIKQTFNPIAELVIPIGIPTKEGKLEMEVHLLTVESAQYNSIFYKLFYGSCWLTHFDLFLQLNAFLFHQYFSI